MKAIRTTIGMTLYVVCTVLGIVTAGVQARYRLDAERVARQQFFWPTIQQRQQVATPRETNTCDERQTTGPICESCELLSTCVRHSSGWVNIPVETCDTQNGFYCNSQLGMCSNSTGPCHPFGYEGNFQCTSHGIFPNPYDCQKYHVCHFAGATLVAATVDCIGSKAFNAATGQCSLSVEHPVCLQKQFSCLNAGDATAWPSNPNIFYICKATSNQEQRVLYPSLYRCADGEVFDGYFCAPSSGTTSTARPSSSTTSSSITSLGSTNSTTTLPGRVCSEVGLSGDPENCRRYYYCSGLNGALRLLECPMGTYYNQQLSSCTLGSC